SAAVGGRDRGGAQAEGEGVSGPLATESGSRSEKRTRGVQGTQSLADADDRSIGEIDAWADIEPMQSGERITYNHLGPSVVDTKRQECAIPFNTSKLFSSVDMPDSDASIM